MNAADAQQPARHRDAGLSLRLRIWLGCLAGALVSAAGLWMAVLWLSGGAEGLDDSSLVWVWLPAAATAGVLVGLGFALWLDHGIVTPLRAFMRGLEDGNVNELRGIPSASGWGEISALTQELQHYLSRHRETSDAARALARLEFELDHARGVLSEWLETERWSPLPVEEDAFGTLSRMLNEGLQRDAEVREQNREASGQVLEGVVATVNDARTSAEQTERGFVEATALLTTVRELQRLTDDMARMSEADEPEAPSPAIGPIRDAASRAIGDLVAASSESVANLSTALLRVREVVDQVQVMGHRATLLALNVLMSRKGSDEGSMEELKTLSREVRHATERAAACADEVELEVARAGERMDLVREKVAATLEGIPTAMEAPAAPGVRDASRLLERMREMVKDATSKGEQLSSASERASRAAERVVRRIEESALELEGLVVRLGPIAPPDAEAGEPSPRGAGDGGPEDAPGHGAELRLLDDEDDAVEPGRRGDET